MTATVACRFVGQASSNISRDNVSNTFHFRYSGVLAPPPDIENVLDMVEDLYCTPAQPSSHGLGWWLNSTINRQARLIVYNLEDPTPRAPIAERAITLPGPGGGNKLPAEVALTCSFQGDRVSGTNQARRRGRIFLGPLNVSGADMTIPSEAMMTSVKDQFKGLLDASESALLWEWVVHSPTSDSFTFVRSGWIDNAWDTQRRRGPRATARMVYS